MSNIIKQINIIYILLYNKCYFIVQYIGTTIYYSQALEGIHEKFTYTNLNENYQPI